VLAVSSHPETGPVPGLPGLPVVPGLRPQAVLLTLFGDHVADDRVLVAGGGVIGLLDRVGVGEAAARATLARMVRRGHLRRDVRGRRAYYGLTEQGARLVADGRTRVLDGSVLTTGWDGGWTMVAFSMPESWQRERHDLRARLVWHGFGLLQAGVWVAPHPVDVPAMLAGLDAGTQHRVRGFRVAPLAPTQAAAMVAEAFDLPGLAARHQAFVDRWTPFVPVAADTPDPLAARVLLAGDWLQTVREDPRLPVELLPAGWPAARAEQLFRTLVDVLDGPAAARLATELERLAIDRGGRAPGSAAIAGRG
jgi:phenylacetic acid degradation operon negative regulatory protein